MKSEHSSGLKLFTNMPWWYTTRGVFMILFGGVIVVMSIIAPNVVILSEKFSWLPIIGMILVAVGGLRCLDAYLSNSTQGFLLNMQGGVLDVIVGSIVLFSVNGQPSDLIHLIAAYLLTQGVLRNVLLFAITISNPQSNRVTGLISIILGLLVWSGWPTSAPWFLSISISVDIAFRGWALIMLASSMKKKPVVDD